MKLTMISKRMALLMVLLMVLSCVMPVRANAVPADETVTETITETITETTPVETIPESIHTENIGNFMWFIHLVVNQPEEYTEALKTLGEAGADEVTVATAAIAAGLDMVPSITQMLGELKMAGAAVILSLGIALGIAFWGLGKSGLVDLLTKILKGLVRNADTCMRAIGKWAYKVWKENFAPDHASDTVKDKTD